MQFEYEPISLKGMIEWDVIKPFRKLSEEKEGM